MATILRFFFEGSRDFFRSPTSCSFEDGSAAGALARRTRGTCPLACLLPTPPLVLRHFPRSGDGDARDRKNSGVDPVALETKTPSSSTCCRGAWTDLTRRHVARAGSPCHRRRPARFSLCCRRVRRGQNLKQGTLALRKPRPHRVPCPSSRSKVKLRGDQPRRISGSITGLPCLVFLLPRISERADSCGGGGDGGGDVLDDAIRHLPLSPEPSPNGPSAEPPVPVCGGGVPSALSHGASAACASHLTGRVPTKEREAETGRLQLLP